jgi:ectoine hydroxylase-related dioxygenase (phytanoyl-CoA dioxygenase family)
MTTAHFTRLDEQGWDLVPSQIPDESINALRHSVFEKSMAGKRSLLDHPTVGDTARDLLRQLAADALIPETSVAIQAIAFDKTAETNWKVAWHQDLMFPFARRVATDGYDLPTVKGGVDYARPPREILECLLAARLHLDDCGASNGPLRVSPGTHRLGIIPGAEVANCVTGHGQTDCLANKGEVLLMRPLTLHASSQATDPGHRRVLHFVFYSGSVVAEPWHRTIGAA